MKKKTPEQKKKELKPLSSIIQVCPVCGKIDVYKNDGHLCNAGAEQRRIENLEYYD